MLYDYLFLGFYSLNKRLLPKSEQPATNAILILSFLLFCNIISTFVLVEQGNGKEIIVTLTPFKIIILVSALVTINSFMFYYKGRYKKILLDTNTRRSERAALIYLLFSVSIWASFISYLL